MTIGPYRFTRIENGRAIRISEKSRAIAVYRNGRLDASGDRQENAERFMAFAAATAPTGRADSFFLAVDSWIRMEHYIGSFIYRYDGLRCTALTILPDGSLGEIAMLARPDERKAMKALIRNGAASDGSCRMMLKGLPPFSLSTGFFEGTIPITDKGAIS